MKYREWDLKIKAKIVLEGLQNKISLAELAIGIKNRTLVFALSLPKVFIQ